MKSAIEVAIKALANASVKDGTKPNEAMQYTQAALNLAHLLAILGGLRA